MSPVPAFLQRLWLVGAARRALAAGRPETAIALLEDPRLCEHEPAERLRQRALLAMRGKERHGGAVDRASEILALLRGLADKLGTLAAAGPGFVAGAGPGAYERPGAAVRFHLAVDDAGAFLAAVGPKLVIGHSRGGRADLPLLADVAPDHALLRLVGPTFHGGASWRIEPLGKGRIEIDGAAVPSEGRALTHADRVVLARNCGFRFLLPDPASASAVLELEAGLECLGAHSILLVVPGAAGRVQIGARHHHHIRAPLGEHPVALRCEPGRLHLACEAGLRLGGAAETGQAVELTLECPPSVAQHLTVGEPPAGQRPFGISIASAQAQ